MPYVGGAVPLLKSRADRVETSALILCDLGGDKFTQMYRHIVAEKSQTWICGTKIESLGEQPPSDILLPIAKLLSELLDHYAFVEQQLAKLRRKLFNLGLLRIAARRTDLFGNRLKRINDALDTIAVINKTLTSLVSAVRAPLDVEYVPPEQSRDSADEERSQRPLSLDAKAFALLGEEALSKSIPADKQNAGIHSSSLDESVVNPLASLSRTGLSLDDGETKLDHRLVDPEILKDNNERFVERSSYSIVLRVLSSDEIETYAVKSKELRTKKQSQLERQDRAASVKNEVVPDLATNQQPEATYATSDTTPKDMAWREIHEKKLLARESQLKGIDKGTHSESEGEEPIETTQKETLTSSSTSTRKLYDICLRAFRSLIETCGMDPLRSAFAALEMWGIGLFEPGLFDLDTLLTLSSERGVTLSHLVTKHLVHIAIAQESVLREVQATTQYEGATKLEKLRTELLALFGRDAFIEFATERWSELEEGRSEDSGDEFSDDGSNEGSEESSDENSDERSDESRAGRANGLESAPPQRIQSYQQIRDAISCLNDLLQAIRTQRQIQHLRLEEDGESKKAGSPLPLDFSGVPDRQELQSSAVDAPITFESEHLGVREWHAAENENLGHNALSAVTEAEASEYRVPSTIIDVEALVSDKLYREEGQPEVSRHTNRTLVDELRDKNRTLVYESDALKSEGKEELNAELERVRLRSEAIGERDASLDAQRPIVGTKPKSKAPIFEIMREGANPTSPKDTSGRGTTASSHPDSSELRVPRTYLDPETLEYYGVPWAWDDPGRSQMVIKRWLSKGQQDVLFKHTRRQRWAKAGQVYDIETSDPELSEQPIDLRSTKSTRAEPDIPTWIKVNRRYLEPETLNHYQLPWQWNDVDHEFILIRQWMTAEQQDVLFEHTRRQRAARRRSRGPSDILTSKEAAARRGLGPARVEV